MKRHANPISRCVGRRIGWILVSLALGCAHSGSGSSGVGGASQVNWPWKKPGHSVPNEPTAARSRDTSDDPLLPASAREELPPPAKSGR